MQFATSPLDGTNSTHWTFKHNNKKNGNQIQVLEGSLINIHDSEQIVVAHIVRVTDVCAERFPAGEFWEN